MASTTTPGESNTPESEPDYGLIIVTSDAVLEQRIHGALVAWSDIEVGCWRDVDGAAQLSRELGSSTRAVILGPDLKRQALLELATALRDARPEIAVVIVRKPSKHLLHSALTVRARAVVDPDAPLAELRDALLRAISPADRRPPRLEPDGGARSQEAGGTDPVDRPTPDAPQPMGSRTRAAWWSRGEGEQAIASLRSSATGYPGRPTEVRGHQHEDAAPDDLSVRAFEDSFAAARGALGKLVRIREHHAAARAEIARAGALIDAVATELARVLEEIDRGSGAHRAN